MAPPRVPVLPRNEVTIGEPRDDHELLCAARRGEHDAGAALLRRHGASMVRTAWNVLGRYGALEADDVVQEALIAALTTAAVPSGDVGAWLRAIVARKALDGRRSFARRAEEHASDGAALQDPHDAEAPLAVVMVRRALARLGPKDRAVLTLVDLEGFSIAETAAALGSTRAAIKWRAVRARRRLRAWIEGETDE